MNQIEREIRLQIVRVCRGLITPAELSDWLVPIAVEILAENSEASDLVAAAMLRLSEHSNGDWSDKELCDLLLPVATTYNVNLAPSMVENTSSGPVIRLEAPARVFRPQVQRFAVLRDEPQLTPA